MAKHAVVSRRALIESGVMLGLLTRVACGSQHRVVNAVSLTAEETERFLAVICDAIIPDSDTPGAGAAGVPHFLLRATASHLAKASPTDCLTVMAALSAMAGSPFLQIDPRLQFAAQEQLDDASFAHAGTAEDRESYAAWRRLKKLTLMGYYTSMVGASQELRYQLVPGRYDPDVILSEDERAWSSDWLAWKPA
jgi:hypothetical protein